MNEEKNSNNVKNNNELNPSFYEKRMSELEINEENNRFSVFNNDAEFPELKRREIQIFSEDKDGNIRINFWDTDRNQFSYIKMGSGKMGHVNGKRMVWFQTRLAEPKGDCKYIMPKGQGVHPFLPPLLIEAFENQQTIETLFITEGAFKAWLATLKGAYTVGLTSITHYRDSETGDLHNDIIRIIKNCNVSNVVILWDGDCLNISEKQLFDKEDISKRPEGFFNAAKNIKELVEKIDFEETRNKVRIYFYHVKSDCLPDSPKGLDDLFISAGKEKAKSIIKEMLNPQEASNFYFHKQNITTSTQALFNYFCLHSFEFFYFLHAEKIKLNEFNFKNDIYYYDEGKNKVILVHPAWAKNIKWIGDDFFKIIEKPDVRGNFHRVLEKRKKQTLSDLHSRDFQKHLAYYEGFCNIPDHFNYKQVHGKFYNRYHPFTWIPEEGTYETTLNFIKHIFGNKKVRYKGVDYFSWELGLDYLQLLITKPTQILPVICLYSSENNTGKSTFGKWQKLIFGHNYIQIGNNDFKSDFNDHWGDKLVAVCEETLLDRKKDVEQIKAYATSDKLTVNPKGYARFEIDFFCKFQFYSNNIRMIYVTKYDERFWIIEVPKPKEEDPNLMDQLKKEIPAFLYFLKNRPLKTQKESRMWFHPSLIRTDTFLETVRVNEPTDARNLREAIKEMFLDFGQDQIMMPMKHILKEFFSSSVNSTWVKELLTDYLGVEKLRTTEGKLKQVRGSYFKLENIWNKEEEALVSKKIEVKFNDRPYVFNRKDFISEEDEVYQDTDQDENNLSSSTSTLFSDNQLKAPFDTES